MVGASGFEPPTSWSRTRRSSQAEPRPDVFALKALQSKAMRKFKSSIASRSLLLFRPET